MLLAPGSPPKHPWRTALALCLAAAASAWPAWAQDVAPKGRTVLRFGLSRAMFKEVNENDAAAAVSVYMKALGDEFGINLVPLILEGPAGIADALRRSDVDLLALNADEFLALEQEGLEGPLLVSAVSQHIAEEYVLLVPEDGVVKKVEDLRGRDLIVSTEAQASLARIWLEVLCRQHGLDSPAALGKVTTALKPTQVVLPVFFGKSDACIATRGAWELMGELNPQVKRRLRPIAVSPPVVGVLTCFRRGVSPALKQKIVRAIAASHAKPAFQQLMALFKVGKQLVEPPPSVLEGTRELMASYQRLTSDKKRAAPAPADASTERYHRASEQ
jgi:ABC-type phosphate/phosphonate transport system substrate-binding protein